MDKKNAPAPSRWTLPQALTWIFYRDTARVNRVGERPSSPMDVLNAAVREAGGNEEEEKACLAGRDDLVAELKSGLLEAYGIGTGHRIHAPIPCLAWETINLCMNLMRGWSRVMLDTMAARSIEMFWSMQTRFRTYGHQIPSRQSDSSTLYFCRPRIAPVGVSPK
jgi:hypothetical protein